MKHLKKTLIYLFVVSCVASMFFIGAGSGKEEAPPVEEEIAEAVDLTVKGDPTLKADLTYWGWLNAPPKAVYEKFKEYYPNVNITFEDVARFDQAPKLLNAFLAGTGAPDIALVADMDLPLFYEKGFYDVTNRMTPYKTLFVPDKFNKVVRQTDGRILGVPWDGGPALIFYRKDLFDKYGVNPDDIETWVDYLEVGKEFVAKTNGKIKWQISNIQMNTGGIYACICHDHTILAQQLGAGGWFNKDGKLIIDGPESIRTIKYLTDLRRAGITMNDLASGEAEVATWKEGTVACYPHACWLKSWFMRLIPDMGDKFGFMLLPAWEEGGPRGSNLGGSSVYITEQCKNPEAAWAFLKFWLLSVEGRVESYKAGGLFEQVFTPAAEDEFFQQPDDYFGEGWFQTCFESARQTPVGYENPNRRQTQGIMQKNIADVVNAKIAAEQGMERIAEKIRLEIGE